MNISPPMAPDLRLFAQALLSGRPLESIIAEFGALPEEDQPVSLAGADPAALESLVGSKVIPTESICKYLASDDDMTHAMIDSMELALERDCGVAAPFFITSRRENLPNGFCKPTYFYLDKEEGN